MSTEIVFNGPFEVQNMDQSSVFVGDLNIANGWGAHSKDNFNIKVEGHNSIIQNNISYIFDQDGIDFYIDDRDIHILHDESQMKAPTNINLDAMYLNTLQQNSNIFFGKGNLAGADAHGKNNFSIGPLRGNYNQANYNFNITTDEDIVDSPIFDQDIKTNHIWKDD